MRGQPELLALMLTQVLNTRQPELLNELIKLYAAEPSADPILLGRAQGMSAKYRGDYNEAIRIYRSLVIATPDDVRIRLDLAAMLAEDRQWHESETVFTEIRRQEDIPSKLTTTFKAT